MSNCYSKPSFKIYRRCSGGAPQFTLQMPEEQSHKDEILRSQQILSTEEDLKRFLTWSNEISFKVHKRCHVIHSAALSDCYFIPIAFVSWLSLTSLVSRSLTDATGSLKSISTWLHISIQCEKNTHLKTVVFICLTILKGVLSHVIWHLTGSQRHVSYNIEGIVAGWFQVINNVMSCIISDDHLVLFII